MRVEQPKVVSDYLDREVSLNRMWKVPAANHPREVHLSPMGIIPKKNKPNKWRLIEGGSIKWRLIEGGSINNRIAPELSSLSYPSIDHLSALVVSAGRGSFMVKADIKEAYRMVPVHPEDQHLLGVRWGNFIFIDKVLPFGPSTLCPSTIHPLDVDSVVQAVTPAQLLMFPSILMVELNNTVPNEVEEVAGAVCIAKFGYRILAYMDAVQKEELCEYFERQGITILPHHTSTVFCTGSPLVGLHQLARGLEELRIRFVMLVGYGMKTPYSDMQLLCHHWKEA